MCVPSEHFLSTNNARNLHPSFLGTLCTTSLLWATFSRSESLLLCSTPISIKVALGIVLWSLKAIVWWTLLSKALHCILCFNDHFPKQPLVNRNSCMHKYVKLTFLASIDCMVGPCKCLNQLTRNIYWRTELFLSWDLHVQLSHSVFLLQLAETEVIRHCRLGGYVFPYQYNFCFR